MSTNTYNRINIEKQYINHILQAILESGLNNFNALFHTLNDIVIAYDDVSEEAITYPAYGLALIAGELPQLQMLIPALRYLPLLQSQIVVATDVATIVRIAGPRFNVAVTQYYDMYNTQIHDNDNALSQTDVNIVRYANGLIRAVKNVAIYDIHYEATYNCVINFSVYGDVMSIIQEGNNE